MNRKLFCCIFMVFGLAIIKASPIDLNDIEDDLKNKFDDENGNSINNVHEDLKELKRVTRQFPFAGGPLGLLMTMSQGGFGGGFGPPGFGRAGGFGPCGGFGGNPPNITQMVAIARQILNALDAANVGQYPTGQDPGQNPPLTPNELSRMRRLF